MVFYFPSCLAAGVHQEILRPLAWDGESLIMLGDDAKVYYEKQ